MKSIKWRNWGKCQSYIITLRDLLVSVRFTEAAKLSASMNKFKTPSDESGCSAQIGF